MNVIKSPLLKTFYIEPIPSVHHGNSSIKKSNRFKQILINNNFPNYVVDREIARFLNNKMINVDNTNDNVNNINPTIANKNDTRNNKRNRSQDDNDEDIKIYFKNQMTNNYRREENTLKRIIHNE